jgi:hypothetical protein
VAEVSGLFVAQYFQHAVALLLFSEKFGRYRSSLVSVDDDVFGGRNQAMLDPPVSSQAFLIGAGVEESEEKCLVVFNYRQEHLGRMSLRVVVVHAVAGKATEVDFVEVVVPVIDGEHDVFLIQPPNVRQMGNERAIHHVPKLLVVLQLLI